LLPKGSIMSRRVALVLVLLACGIPAAAVFSGFVTAFLMSPMSAEPKAPEVPSVEILVASKELPTGTKFTIDSLKNQVKRKKVPQDQVPDGAVTSEFDLLDRQLQKTVKAEENLRSGDTVEVKNSIVPPPGKDLITVRLPTEDLPAGTEITFDLIKTKFKEVEFVAPAPENAVVKIDEFLGKYLTEKVHANQFVPKSCVGNMPEKKEAPKRETFDRTISQGAAEDRVYRFEKQDDGSWKLLGEVKKDGSVVPVPGNVSPPAK
jgi:hypothetical protein